MSITVLRWLPVLFAENLVDICRSFLTFFPPLFFYYSGRVSHTTKISPSGIDSSPKSSSSVSSSNSSISSSGSTTSGANNSNPNNPHFVGPKNSAGVMSSAAIPIPVQGHQTTLAQAEVRHCSVYLDLWYCLLVSWFMVLPLLSQCCVDVKIVTTVFTHAVAFSLFSWQEALTQVKA